MSYYYLNLNQQSSGDYEVHKDGCFWLTLIEHKKYLGDFDNCKSAVKKAQETHINADGCKHCCPLCHTS